MAGGCAVERRERVERGGAGRESRDWRALAGRWPKRDPNELQVAGRAQCPSRELPPPYIRAR